jgi:hypothetical protein
MKVYDWSVSDEEDRHEKWVKRHDGSLGWQLNLFNLRLVKI